MMCQLRTVHSSYLLKPRLSKNSVMNCIVGLLKDIVYEREEVKSRGDTPLENSKCQLRHGQLRHRWNESNKGISLQLMIRGLWLYLTYTSLPLVSFTDQGRDMNTSRPATARKWCFTNCHYIYTFSLLYSPGMKRLEQYAWCLGFLVTKQAFGNHPDFIQRKILSFYNNLNVRTKYWTSSCIKHVMQVGLARSSLHWTGVNLCSFAYKTIFNTPLGSLDVCLQPFPSGNKVAFCGQKRDGVDIFKSELWVWCRKCSTFYLVHVP